MAHDRAPFGEVLDVEGRSPSAPPARLRHRMTCPIGQTVVQTFAPWGFPTPTRGRWAASHAREKRDTQGRMASTSSGGEPGPGVNTTTPLPFGDRERQSIRGSSETAARIDRYALLRVLGGGGMGVVYAAYDEHLDRKVALKVLSERNTIATAADRMHREAQALARLSHPNVVGVHDVGISEGRVFMAMEFISGQTVRTWLRAERRSHEAILRVFVEAGRGLAAAHAAGIVHRDFKPDNVIVGDYGSVCRTALSLQYLEFTAIFDDD